MLTGSVNIFFNVMDHGDKITFTHKGRRSGECNFLKFLIGSQPIIERCSLICGTRGYHYIYLDNARNTVRKSCFATFGGKGYSALLSKKCSYISLYHMSKTLPFSNIQVPMHQVAGVICDTIYSRV